jgi:hypothetical protein
MVPLNEVIEFLAAPRECNCDQRRANLKRAAGDRTHTGRCDWWPDNEFTLVQVATMLREKFGAKT